MHISGKVLLIVGGLFLAGGLAMMFGGGAMASDGVDDLENFEAEFIEENSTSGSLTITDYDGMGEIGFSFWVKGTHVDADNNSMWDDCENVNLTLSNSTADNFFNIDCSYDGNYSESERRGDEGNIATEQGLIWIGQGCAGDCANGTYFFDSNTPVWVQYDDETIGEFLGDLGEVIGGGMLWCFSWCFTGGGVFLLLLGLILGFAIRPNPGPVVMQQPGMMMQQPMMVQQPMMQQPVTPQPVTPQPTQTQMSEPVFEEPKVYEQPEIENNDSPPGGL